MRRRISGFRLLLVGLGLAGLVGGLGGVTYAAFSAATANPASSFTAKAIYPGVRATAAWDLKDKSTGTENDFSASLGFNGGGNEESNSSFPTGYQAGRYIDFDFNSPLPAGLALPGGATFSFRISSSNPARDACYYPEARTKAGVVIATYSGSERCVSGTTYQTTTVSMPDVDTTAEANDLVVRVFAKSTPTGAIRYDHALVTGSFTYASFTLYPNSEADRSNGTSTTTTTWGVAAQDAATYTSQTTWSSSFDSSKYLTFNFPAYVPTTATMGTVTIDHRFRSASGTTCWWFEVLAGTSVVESFGSSSTPHQCNTAGQWLTSSATLTSTTTGTRANTLSVRAYMRNSAGQASEHDFVRLNVDYTLAYGAGAGCATPGSSTVYTTKDATVDQSSGSSNFGTDAKLIVDSKATNLNARSYLGFTLPSIPAGCSVVDASLRVYQLAANGTRTIQLLRASGAWAENTITWNNQPGTTGTATTSGVGTGWRAWDATAHVQAMVAGTNDGFALRDATENSATEFKQEYASDEDSSFGPPELTVTWG